MTFRWLDSLKQVLRRTSLLVVVCTGVNVSYGQDQRDLRSVDLATVLERAQEYVAVYETQLGTIIGEEEYVQEAVWRVREFVGRTLPRLVLQPAERARRRLDSDFLLIPVGTTWFGVRNVLSVDGIEVESRGDFAYEVAASDRAVIATWPDNVRYNIGDFRRTFNVPTFALTILRSSRFHRFSFEKDSERRIEGVETWEVRFREVVSPALVRGLDGEDRFAHGKLYINPESGEILGTEMVFEVEGEVKFEARVEVSYEFSPELRMLVPRRMEEFYDSELHSVEARADYSNFQHFGVEVKLSPGTAEP